MLLFASTIALSAFLLFLVQPIIAKQILPWFGGSSAVWTTCMVFFQCVLLAGYFYADTLIRRVGVRRQAIVHTALLLVSLAALPIVASEALKPQADSEPVGRILLLLAVTIGLPYLMLSTTGPLVQAWFARRFEHGQVYRLYALSNVASLGALIAYPPLIEPLTTVKVQSWAWSAGYALFAVLAAASAWAAVRGGARPHQPVEVQVSADAPLQGPAPATDDSPAAPAWHRQLLWLTLSALGSVMLLGTTTHITQNVASVPFLWVLPLVIYLTTFILTFDGQGWYRPSWMVPLAALLALVMLAALSWRVDPQDVAPWLQPVRSIMPVTQAVPLYGIGLFLACMFCHGELVRRKPHPQHLTRFYLMVSLGGAVGGLLIGVVAPSVYNWTWEFAQALALTALLAAGLSLASKAWWRGGLCALCAAGCLVAYHDYDGYVRQGASDMSRNFYGTLRVQAVEPDSELNARDRLLHGVIIHGEQYRNPERRREATTYYGPNSGIGVTLQAMREIQGNGPQRAGLVGLGVGTLATYGRKGDHYRIYEINPQVLELAKRRFSYLSQSEAEIVTPLGDARLVLEREPPQRLHVLAIDAFSSDSIPVHLITREAMEAYRRHVVEDGAIVFHITNRYLDLRGVVRQLADQIGWQAVLVVDEPPSDSPQYHSDWVVITRNDWLLELLRKDDKGTLLPGVSGRRPWTDDFNNLFEVLK